MDHGSEKSLEFSPVRPAAHLPTPPLQNFYDVMIQAMQPILSNQPKNGAFLQSCVSGVPVWVRADLSLYSCCPPPASVRARSRGRRRELVQDARRLADAGADR